MKYTKHLLIDDSRCFLHVFDGDGDRFVQHFRNALSKIPPNIRVSVESLFDSIHAVFELSDSWHPKHAYGQVDTSMAGRNVIQMCVKFRASAFEHLPRQAAEYVIAHELAHVFQKCPSGPFSDDPEETERIADDLAKQWGFKSTYLNLIDAIQSSRGISLDRACEEVSMLSAKATA